MKATFALMLLGALIACSQPAPPTGPDSAVPHAYTAGDPPATPTALVGDSGALGSGCAPHDDALPDGAWFGRAMRWDASGIDFDLVCFYAGAAAVAQATARNDEAFNDYYLINDSTKLRRLEVAANVTAYRLSATNLVDLERTTYADLVAGPVSGSSCPGESCAIWVFVNNGRVTEVMMQFFP